MKPATSDSPSTETPLAPRACARAASRARSPAAKPIAPTVQGSPAAEATRATRARIGACSASARASGSAEVGGEGLDVEADAGEAVDGGEELRQPFEGGGASDLRDEADAARIEARAQLVAAQLDVGVAEILRARRRGEQHAVDRAVVRLELRAQQALAWIREAHVDRRTGCARLGGRVAGGGDGVGARRGDGRAGQQDQVRARCGHQAERIAPRRSAEAEGPTTASA